jgi:hypothetical protein
MYVNKSDICWWFSKPKHIRMVYLHVLLWRWNKKKRKNLAKIICLQNLLLCVRLILWRIMLSRIYQRRNFPVISGTKLSPTFDKICIMYLQGTIEKRGDTAKKGWEENQRSYYVTCFIHVQNVPGGRVSIMGGHSVCFSKQKLYMYMRPIPNGSWDRAISLYNVQTSNTPCPHMSCKVHWCWRWNFRKCIILVKLYQLYHLNNKYRY